ncbi:hypothetical protein IWW34DRAFT_796311 [Fusarium oxysporum f. sp. albedinis]|nr:hypothetical protein IWW34DRAFT_796311 [Fusarium oxysporum f. sp. albedinis]
MDLLANFGCLKCNPTSQRHDLKSLKRKERMPRIGQALTAVKYTTALRQGCDMKQGSATLLGSPHNLKAEVGARHQPVERVPECRALVREPKSNDRGWANDERQCAPVQLQAEFVFNPLAVMISGPTRRGWSFINDLIFVQRLCFLTC